jgi:hypothetical protein
MQYQGHCQILPDGSIFWGVGQQQGNDHFLMQASGSAADRVARWLMVNEERSDFNITRLDLQLTVPIPSWFNARHFLDALRVGDWKGRRRKATMIDNYGDDTVYIGSRQSDKFCRVYVKEEDFLRLEFEYKKGKADAVYWMLKRHGIEKAGAGLLHGEVLQLPEHPVTELFLENLSNYEKMIAITEKRPSSRFRWFVKQCAPAIQTLLRDHDAGDATRRVLEDLLTGDW